MPGWVKPIHLWVFVRLNAPAPELELETLSKAEQWKKPKAHVFDPFSTKLCPDRNEKWGSSEGFTSFIDGAPLFKNDGHIRDIFRSWKEGNSRDPSQYLVLPLTCVKHEYVLAKVPSYEGDYPDSFLQFLFFHASSFVRATRNVRLQNRAGSNGLSLQLVLDV